MSLSASSTPWQSYYYGMDGKTLVGATRTNPDGTVESRLLTDPAVAAFIAGGGVLTTPPVPTPFVDPMQAWAAKMQTWGQQMVNLVPGAPPPPPAPTATVGA